MNEPDGRRWRAEEHPAWQARPGRKVGPQKTIEELLDEGYAAHAWMRDKWRGQEPTKGRFCEKMNFSRPVGNRYLKGAGLPFPFPHPSHPAFVVNADDHRLHWVNQSLAEALLRTREELIGQEAHKMLRG